MTNGREKSPISFLISQAELPANTLRDEAKVRLRLSQYASTFSTMLRLLRKRDAYNWQRTTYDLQRQEIQLARAGLHDMCGMISGRLMTDWKKQHSPEKPK